MEMDLLLLPLVCSFILLLVICIINIICIIITNNFEWRNFNFENKTIAEDWDKLEEEEEDLPVVEEFVVKNLDEVKAKKKDKLANRIHGPLTNEDRKFMVVCFDNFISIFSLPSYQLYSSYECRNRPVSANVAQIDGCFFI